MKKRIVAIALVLVLVLSVTMASAASYFRLKKAVSLHVQPNTSSKITDTYRKDWALTVNKDVNKTWAKITFTNGVSGYVQRSHYVKDRTYTAYISKDKIKLRRGPNYSFTTLATLSKGTSVTVLTTGSSYSFVKTKSGTGYVQTNALSTTKVKATVETEHGLKKVNYTAWVVSNGGDVGLRSKASRSNDVVFALYGPGTQVTVLGEGSQFCYVKVGSSYGFMRTPYLSKTKP